METQTNNPLFDLSALNLQSLGDPLFDGEALPKKEGERFVVFILGEELYAVPAVNVAEVSRPLAFTPLPGSPPWLSGVANLRGEIVTVISLNRLFRKKPGPAAPRSKFIILKPTQGNGPVAFAVDRLAEVVQFAPSEIGPADGHLFLGCADHGGAQVNIVDTYEILSSLL